ncbi:hypothetical protein ACTG5T_02650 [Pasteurella multocida]
MKKLLTFVATCLLSVQAFAVDFKPFEQAAFDVALQSDKPVLVRCLCQLVSNLQTSSQRT